MSRDRIPKKLLFGWLPQTRPAYGAKLSWRDKVRQDRIAWKGVCQDGLQRVQNAGIHTVQLMCETCHQEFWGSQDIASVRQLGHWERKASYSLVHY